MSLFSANDTIDILIAAKVTGTEKVVGLDQATKALIATQQTQDATNNKINTSLGNLDKTLSSIDKTISKLGESTKKSTKEAGDALDELDKKLKSVISNPASSISSPFALAGRAVQQFASALGPVGIIATGVATGIGVAATAIVGLTLKAAESETELRNFALRLDLPVQAARRLQIEAQLAGVSANVLEASIRTLSAGLDDPGGAGKKQAAMLRELGIAARDASGNNRDLGEVVLEVYDKLGKVTDRTKQAHEATVVLGRGAKELIPAIDIHARLEERVRRLADAYGGDLNPKFTEGKLAIETLAVEFDAFAKTLEVKIIPFLAKAADLIGKINFGKVASVAAGVVTVGALPAWMYRSAKALFDQGKAGLSPTDTLGPDVLAGNIKGGPSGKESLVAQNDALKSITSGIDQKYLDPLEKLELQLKAVKAAEAELNKGGIVPAADLSAYDALKQQGAQIERNIKSYREGTAYAKELANALQEYGKRAAEAVGGETSAIAKLEAERKSALEYVDFKYKGDPRLKAFVTTTFDAKETSEYQKEDTRLLDDQGKAQIEVLQHRYDIQGKLIELNGSERKSHADVSAELERQLALAQEKLAVELATPSLKDKAQGNYHVDVEKANDNAQIQNIQINNRDKKELQDAQRRIREIQDAAENKQYTQQAGFQSRLLEVNSKPGDEVATANQIAQIQLNLEHQRNEAEVLRATAEGNIFKEEEALLKLRYTDEENIAKIRDEAILRQAEATKKDRQEWEQGAAKVYDALTNKSGGGFTALFKEQTNQLAKTVFVNASGLLFDKTDGKGLGLSSLIGGQRGEDGKLNPLGSLLQGTPFGDKGLNTPAAKTADNTLRTAIAVEALASGVGGATTSFPYVSSGSGDQSSTSLAGAFSFLGGGSSPSPDALVPGLAGITYGMLNGAQASSSSVPSLSTSSLSSTLGGLFKGGMNPSSVWSGGSWGNPDANGIQSFNENSGTQEIGAGIGAAGAGIAGVLGAIKGFSKGGVGGTAQGIASIAGAAAALDPEPISKLVLTGVTLLSGIVSSVFGNSKQERADQISSYVADNNTSNQYITDPKTGALSLNPNYRGKSISEAYDISGNQAIYQSNGNVAVSGGGTVNHNTYITALDTQSFADALSRNRMSVATSVQEAMLINGHGLAQTIQQRG